LKKIKAEKMKELIQRKWLFSLFEPVFVKYILLCILYWYLNLREAFFCIIHYFYHFIILIKNRLKIKYALWSVLRLS
jgi:hypothetical protein